MDFRTSLARCVALSAFLVGGLALIWVWPAAGERQLAAALLGSYLLCWAVFLWFSERKSDLYIPFVVVSATLALLLVLLEAAGQFGVADYRALFGRGSGGGVVLEEDGIVFGVYEPGLRVVGSVPGSAARLFCLPDRPRYSYDVTYDRNGFRSPVEREVADVAVIGDSFVEAARSPAAALVGSQLEELSGLTVASLGISGHGPRESLGVLKRFGIPMARQAVIWVFYEGNDLRELGQRRDDPAERWRGSPPTLVDRSFVKNALEAIVRLRRECVPYASGERRSGLFGHGRDTATVYFVDDARLEPLESAGLQLLPDVLGEAYRETSAHGIRLIFVFNPAKYRVYDGYLHLPVESDLYDWTPDDLPTRMAELVRAVSPQIAFVDLTPVFRAAAGRGQLAYFADDPHWNESGHRLAAQAIRSALTAPAESLLAPDPRGGSR